MNLRLRRLVRTPTSEQYALFDPDRTDENYDPMSIGKLDLHYTSDGIYGTFLLWKQAIEGLPPDLIALPKGCPFYDRCNYRIDLCTQEMPSLNTVGINHRAACHVDVTTAQPTAEHIYEEA